MPAPTPNRRDFFSNTRDGVFGVALASLLSQDLLGDEPRQQQAPRTYDNRPKKPHHAPAATSIIHLFMNGGPSQMDLFDPKPQLDRFNGKPFPGSPEEIGNFGSAGVGVVMGSQYKFQQHGQSGMWMADVLPETASMADELCMIRSMWTDHPNHDNALYKIHSGRLFMGYPTLGSWIAYGLGSENLDMPAYVVLTDPLGWPKNGARNWTAGFLPPVYQGTVFRPTGAPVLNLKPQYQQSDAINQSARELLRQLDQHHVSSRPHQAELGARIESYELAARMQLTASDALDLNNESQATLDLYGVGKNPTDSFARRCLLARRLVERGVRYVQVFLEEQPWDSHVDLKDNHRSVCQRTDRPVAALLKDLKRMGLLDNTLVIWGGEFGRTPTAQKTGTRFTGRDHNMQAFTSWMAGGGTKGGLTYGETDPFGHKVVENPVSVHDFHATILHLLGLHHHDLFFPRSGLNERLTGVNEPHVVQEIIA